MKKLSNNIAVASVVSVVASILVVGLVWAGSSALRSTDTPTTTTLPTDTTDVVDDTTPDGLVSSDASLADVIDALNAVNTRLEDVEKQLVSLEATAQRALDNSNETKIAVDGVKSSLGDITADFKKLADDARDAITRIDAIDKKTLNIDAEGNYTGPIRPNQLTRKLAPDDITGNWPLDRTTGELDADKLVASFSGCWSDYRYNNVVTVDAFRKLGCTRILK